ncbi:MAG TPA: ATP-binding protein [Longimicrobium sp.]|jgi:hypothetical protein|uniref:ATP-binding protein n=1 Tax=Longimicrobium sp. TaxID=2029185 RepID=UPI002EDABA1D
MSQQSQIGIAEHEQYDDVAPDASSMIESMRAYGYTLQTAIADLVDNSIAAGCKSIWIRFEWAGADSWISVSDDGSGMTEAELVCAMRLGSKSPLQPRSPTDLGRFGLGLKTASLSQCRRLTVTARPKPGQDVVRRWDLDHLARSDVQGWQLLRSAYPGSESRAAVPDELERGTVVLWEHLDRLVGPARKDDNRAKRHFFAAVADVATHLGMVFHRYLDRSHNNRIQISINGDWVTPWDPFLENHPATEPTPEEEIVLPGFPAPIRLRGFVLPHKDRLGDAAHQAASGLAGWNAQQGFYLYRNERLIIAGSWLGLGGARPWTQEEHYKLARIRLEIPNTMDHVWQVDVKKSTAQAPALIRDRLTGLAQKVRIDARAVYAYRGKYGPRTKLEEIRRPWKSVRQNGIIRYKIDREHPLVGSVLAGAERRAEIEAVFRVLEETVPVEQIWLDSAESPDALRAPFHGSTSNQVRTLVEVAYRAIRRNQQLSHHDTVLALLQLEEFAGEETRAIIASLAPKNNK